MKFDKAEKLARKYMEHHGLQGWKFEKIRSKRVFGRCQYAPRNTIQLSKPLVEVNDCKRVLDTILHEISHALVGYGYGHNLIFMKKCIEIGAKPRQYASENDTVLPKPKYKGICGYCGKQVDAVERIPRIHKTHSPCYRSLPTEDRFKAKVNYFINQ